MIKNSVELVKMFHASLDGGKLLDFAMVNGEAIKRGYLVKPEACTKEVLDFIKSETINPNATFYKEWNDILSKTRFELLIDQLIHYTTTYGMGVTNEHNGYVPNDGDTSLVPQIDATLRKMTVISAITQEEMFKKCMGMLQSGIALKNETLQVVCNAVCDADFDVDVDSISNREALVIICERLGVYPTQPINLFRYILYTTVGDAMIIKNKVTTSSILRSTKVFNFDKLTRAQLRGLSTIFYRFKPIFLAFKAADRYHNAHVVNKIRKMAYKNHRPMITPFWNNVLSVIHTEDEIAKHLSELTNYKKVVILQTLNERMHSNNPYALYVIRNKRTYVTPKKYKVTPALTNYWHVLYNAVRASLVESLSKKAVPCKFPTNFHLMCPTSEKNYIGDYPFGTYFDMQGNNYIGIYWRGEWGTQDFDLSSNDITGVKVGWNSDYVAGNGAIIYSGDMTRANPEAAEVLYCRGDFRDTMIKINRYNGSEGSKFKLFLGTSESQPFKDRGYSWRDSWGKGYIVDPNTIKFTVDCVSQDMETSVGVVHNRKFFLCDMKSGNGMVSCASENAKNTLATTIDKLSYYVPMEDILRDAGFTEYVEETDGEWTES